MNTIGGFKEIVPYLTNPLVLVGYVLLCVFGVHRALLKARIIPPLTILTAGKVVQSVLRYGCVIALVVIILGFLLAFYQTRMQHDPDVLKGQAETARLEALAAITKGAYCQHPEDFKGDEAAWRDVVRACATAVEALARQPDVSAPTKEDALIRLRNNDAQGAKAIFQTVLERKTAEGKAANREAAEAARHLGALGFYDNTQEALAAYQRAVELDPDNADGWNQLAYLLGRVGQLNAADAAYRKVELIGESRNDRGLLAVAYGNLGNVHRTRGDLVQAEVMYKKALEINEALGNKEGTAAAYGNLGIVYEIRGDLVQAEAMEKKTLEIDEAAGNKEDTAAAYGNLGNVYQTRGDLVQAEAMYKKALQVDEALGNKDGMAASYGNLGIVYQTRGDLVQAEAMYKKGLQVDEVLGNKEGMAASYGNLGNVHRIRGDLVQAEAMYKKALEVDKALGNKEGVAASYGNLGIMYQIRGDLMQAETMQKKALQIDEALGNKEGMANDYSSLGVVYQIRGDLVQAEAMQKKALQVDEALGNKDGMANDYGNLGMVYQIRGDPVQAETMQKKSLALFQEVGAAAKVQKIQGVLAALAVPHAPISNRSQNHERLPPTLND